MKKNRLWLEAIYLPFLGVAMCTAIIWGLSLITGNNSELDTSHSLNGLICGIIVYSSDLYRSKVPLFISMGVTRKRTVRYLSYHRLLLSFSCAVAIQLCMVLFSPYPAGTGLTMFLTVLIAFLFSNELEGFLGIFLMRISNKAVINLLEILVCILCMFPMAFVFSLMVAPESAVSFMEQYHILPVTGILALSLHLLLVFVTEKALRTYTVKL